MKTKFSITIAALVAIAAACSSPPETSSDDSKLPALPHDTHSYAQPEKARVTHVSLDLTPDFTTKRIAGIARLTVERAAGADSIVLDTREPIRGVLRVISIRDLDNR